MDFFKANRVLREVQKEYEADITPAVVDRRTRYNEAIHWWKIWYYTGATVLVLVVFVIVGGWESVLDDKLTRTIWPYQVTANTTCMQGPQNIEWCVPAGTEIHKYPHSIDGETLP